MYKINILSVILIKIQGTLLLRTRYSVTLYSTCERKHSFHGNDQWFLLNSYGVKMQNGKSKFEISLSVAPEEERNLLICTFNLKISSCRKFQSHSFMLSSLLYTVRTEYYVAKEKADKWKARLCQFSETLIFLSKVFFILTYKYIFLSF